MSEDDQDGGYWPFHHPLRRIERKLDVILKVQERLLHMSQTVQETIDANNTRMSAALDGITADLTAIAAELKAAVPPVGTTVTQASADAMTALADRLDAVKTAADGLVVSATPPAP